MNSNAPIEKKVSAATGSAAVAGIIMWILGEHVFKGEIPPEVATLIAWLVPAVAAFIGGYLARHTPRPDIGQP